MVQGLVLVTSPPNGGGQAIPHPDPQTLVEEDMPLFTGSEDFTPFYKIKPVQRKTFFLFNTQTSDKQI